MGKPKGVKGEQNKETTAYGRCVNYKIPYQTFIIFSRKKITVLNESA